VPFRSITSKLMLVNRLTRPMQSNTNVLSGSGGVNTGHE